MFWVSAVLAVMLSVSARASDAAPLKVAASILPLHSLVANLVEEENLLPPLLPPASSPHSYALRPLEAQRLHHADVIFWVGPTLESVLARSLSSLPGSVTVVTLFPEADGRGNDPHIWLDPVLAQEIVQRMTDVLAAVDPSHAADYRRRGQATLERLGILAADLDRAFAPVRGVPFVAAHAAYRRLETRFGLNALGALTATAAQPPSVRRIGELRARMRAEGARCIFAEPQHQPRSLTLLAADTGARIVLLDPLGGGIEPGPDTYFTLMERLGARMISCLGAQDQ